MKMIKMILGATTAALVLAGVGARADIDIPDGNPVGVTRTLTESGLGSSISNVTLTLDISGGNNGDLYAYLSYGGQLVTLLNRPGVTGGNPLGYTDPGYNNVILSDGGYANINSYGGSGGAQVTGTYNAADGTVAFQTAYRGLNPNGTWTLFIADLSGGDSSDSQLVNWDLNITAVPEPGAVALGVFGMLIIVVSRRAKKLAGNRPL
jgi:hypothetical protein